MSGGATRWLAATRGLALLLLALLIVAGAAAWWLTNGGDERFIAAPRTSPVARSADSVPEHAPPATGDSLVPIPSGPSVVSPEPERERTTTARESEERPRLREPPLPGSAPLSGRVTTQRGEPAGAGIRVLALLPRELIDLPMVERVRDGAVEGRRVFTDGDGSFRFPSLPAVLYRVMAGGRGFVSQQVGPAWAPSDCDLDVPVDAVFGLEIQLLQEGGATLPTRGDFGPPLTRPDLEAANDSRLDELRAVVAGVRLEQLGNDRRRRALLQTRRETAGDAIGPWPFHFEEPGFLPRHESIALPRMGDRLATQTFELVPAPGIRFGTLDVRLIGWPKELPPPPPDALLGRIAFHPPPPHGSEWHLALQGRDLDGCRVEGVPQGSWECTFTPTNQAYVSYETGSPELLLAQVGAGSSHLVIDLRGTGHLLLHVRGTTSDRMLARRSIVIAPLHGGSNMTHLPVDGRVELHFLRPGDYVARARPSSLATSADGRASSVEFTIAPGAVTRCELRVDD